MKIDVLDHGYVQLIETWGDGVDGDEDYEVGIIEAARQSTQASFRGWDEDAKLLRFLHKNNHSTPFEFAGMVIEVQAPIFVFREWHRHRTQSYNEMSARYAPLPDLYYTPDRSNVVQRGEAAGTNRQASSIAEFHSAVVDPWLANLDQFYRDAERLYQDGLAAGIPKELARVVMPVGHYTRMRASANLRNWLAFLTLRQDSKAQWEIRQYADAVGKCVAVMFPQTWACFAHAEAKR
jgi:thymidylate synthase (FAD)